MPEDAKIGMEFLQEALKLDPNYAAARLMAWGMEIRVLRGGFNAADAEAGVRHARAALAYGTDDATAPSVATLALLHLGHDFAAAAGAIARALALNPSAPPHSIGARMSMPWPAIPQLPRLCASRVATEPARYIQLRGLCFIGHRSLATAALRRRRGILRKGN